MTNTKLMLGETCIDDYLLNPKKIDEGKKKEIGSIISKLENNSMNVEELPLKLLKIELEQYPIIDPCFLSMSQTLDYKGTKTLVPRFSIYKKTERGFAPFRIGIGMYGKKEGQVNIRGSDDFSYLILDQLINSFEFAQFDKNVEHINDSFFFNGISKDLYKKYKNLDMIRLGTEFQGIIPDETKEKLVKANEIFGNNIYLISETKPEDWNELKITIDPLLIGVLEKNEKCFLIDHFNTTNLEDYIRQEFTE